MGTANIRGEAHLQARLEVEQDIEGEAASLHTRGLRNHGAFLEVSDKQLPPVVSIIYLRLKQGLQGGNAPLVKSMVVHADNDGFALQFIKN